MVLTIHQDAIGNKYIGYAGDVTNVATPSEVISSAVSLITSFPNNSASYSSDLLRWRTDGTAVTGIGPTSPGNSFFTLRISTGRAMFYLNAKDVSPDTFFVENTTNGGSFGFEGVNRGVAYSNGIDVGFFGWDTINNKSIFQWAGEVKGNSNISSPQNRCAITLTMDGGSVIDVESLGVKQPDTNTARLHLDTEAGASHNIDCAEETGRLFLIEDDGAGGDGGTVGYCENLYLSKQTGLTIGGFVTLNGITDGGSTHGIVVGNWGTDAKIIMRVYDGTN